jgi:hypothetical protein
MATKRTYDSSTDDCGYCLVLADKVVATCRAKARHAAEGRRGNKWVFIAVANAVARLKDEALYRGAYAPLEEALELLSGTGTIQSC